VLDCSFSCNIFVVSQLLNDIIDFLDLLPALLSPGARYFYKLNCCASAANFALGLVYTWRTLTGVKLNNNRNQYSKQAIFLPV